MANLHLVTGHAGEPHVKSTDDASLMQAIYGGDSVVLDRNNAFSYDVISNNIIRVYDGEALMQGRYIKMDKGNYVDLSIDNGHTGYRRIDVIAIEYRKNDETNIEEANLVVIKGSETQQEEATVPQLVEGDTVDGSASTNQMALYHVKIDGLSISEVTQAYTVGQDIQTIASEQNNAIGVVDQPEKVTKIPATLSTGKFVGYNPMYIGKIWTSVLENNEDSEYLADTLDLSEHVGDTLKVTLTTMTTGSARSFGFCDSTGKISSIYSEKSSFILNEESGLYEFVTKITDTNFYFSIRVGEYPNFYVISNELVKKLDDRYYKKSEVNRMLDIGYYKKSEVNQMLDGVKYKVLTLIEDVSEPIQITENTIIYGNGHKVDCGIRLNGTFTDGMATIPYDVASSNI